MTYNESQVVSKETGISLINVTNTETGKTQHRIELSGLKNPFAKASMRWKNVSMYVSDIDSALVAAQELTMLLTALKKHDGVVKINGSDFDVRYEKSAKAPKGDIGGDSLAELFGEL